MTSANPFAVDSPRGRIATPAPQGKHQQLFMVSRPKATHFQRIDCKEARCTHYAEGWLTIVPTDGPQADYIKTKSGRSFTIIQSETPGLTTFKFGAEQQCFRYHGKPKDKLENYGHRSRPGAQLRIHERSADWVEHYNDENYKTQRLIEQG